MALDKTLQLTPYKYGMRNYWIGLSLLAFCFSWLSQLLIAIVVPKNFFEIFLIPAFYYLTRRDSSVRPVFKSLLRSQGFIGLFLFITVFFILGFFVSEFNFADTYADFRANLTFVFFLMLALSKKWKEQEREQFLVRLLVVVSMMDLVALLLRPYFAFQVEATVKQTISIVAPAILALYYIRKRKFLASFLFAAIMSYEAIVAFFRNYYFISLVVFFMLLVVVLQNLLSARARISTKFKSLMLVTVMVVITIIAIPIVYNYWMSDGSKMIHSINRTEELLNNESKENERINSLTVVFGHSDEFLLPHGIGWRAFTRTIEASFKGEGIISSMDSCIFYIGYHYGIIMLLLVIFYLFKSIIRSFGEKSSEKRVITPFFRILFLVLFLASFMTQSVMLTIPQSAFVYSILFSIVIKPF
ncbi:MAG TPA: hypothetical protein VHN59_15740 [Chitinophagaceae bacterium]|nr:hypothetical protein [Chitinophagaceae bacterium]